MCLLINWVHNMIELLSTTVFQMLHIRITWGSCFKASQGLQRAAKFENQSFTVQALVRYGQIAWFANILPNEHLLAVIHSTLLVSSSQTLACIRITWRARCWKRNLSDSLGLGWSPMFHISEKFPSGLDAAVRNHLWEPLLMTVITTLLPLG